MEKEDMSRRRADERKKLGKEDRYCRNIAGFFCRCEGEKEKAFHARPKCQREVNNNIKKEGKRTSVILRIQIFSKKVRGGSAGRTRPPTKKKSGKKKKTTYVEYEKGHQVKSLDKKGERFREKNGGSNLKG